MCFWEILGFHKMYVFSSEVKCALGLNMYYCKPAQLGVLFLNLLRERDLSLQDLLCLGFCLHKRLLQNTDLIEEPTVHSLSKKPAHFIASPLFYRAYGGRWEKQHVYHIFRYKWKHIQLLKFCCGEIFFFFFFPHYLSRVAFLLL